jgi:hypothetical protein
MEKAERADKWSSGEVTEQVSMAWGPSTLLHPTPDFQSSAQLYQCHLVSPDWFGRRMNE